MATERASKSLEMTRGIQRQVRGVQEAQGSYQVLQLWPAMLLLHDSNLLHRASFNHQLERE